MAKKFWWIIKIQKWLARRGFKYYEGMLEKPSGIQSTTTLKGGKNK